ncbi:unnamed protein product [Lepeophtheirus salmonis]|uniref:(salmon louse) hypothetical protein n=1 Tax=Lepeophtheirus salmonis TaxID=72036 RepID=A0A7R8CW29_LEPSM|nr:unnamed protein product [Lepeophtheirus salmonis]CAF2916796.1 unnamed protein product [Lepeophtheirus salmonis]
MRNIGRVKKVAACQKFVHTHRNKGIKLLIMVEHEREIEEKMEASSTTRINKDWNKETLQRVSSNTPQAIVKFIVTPGNIPWFFPIGNNTRPIHFMGEQNYVQSGYLKELEANPRKEKVIVFTDFNVSEMYGRDNINGSINSKSLVPWKENNVMNDLADVTDNFKPTFIYK